MVRLNKNLYNSIYNNYFMYYTGNYKGYFYFNCYLLFVYYYFLKLYK